MSELKKQSPNWESDHQSLKKNNNSVWPEPLETSYYYQCCLPRIYFFINYVNAISVYAHFSKQQVVITDAIFFLCISKMTVHVWSYILALERSALQVAGQHGNETILLFFFFWQNSALNISKWILKWMHTCLRPLKMVFLRVWNDFRIKLPFKAWQHLYNTCIVQLKTAIVFSLKPYVCTRAWVKWAGQTHWSRAACRTTPFLQVEPQRMDLAQSK